MTRTFEILKRNLKLLEQVKKWKIYCMYNIGLIWKRVIMLNKQGTTISLCMIVRDEENTIGRCLDAVEKNS